jgi:hypothetical protein
VRPTYGGAAPKVCHQGSLALVSLIGFASNKTTTPAIIPLGLPYRLARNDQSRGTYISGIGRNVALCQRRRKKSAMTVGPALCNMKMARAQAAEDHYGDSW